MRALAALLLLTACSTAGDDASDASDAAIANRAESLERAAGESTDQAISDIEAQSNADMAADAPPAEAANSVAE